MPDGEELTEAKSSLRGLFELEALRDLRRYAVIPILLLVVVYSQIQDPVFLSGPSFRDMLTQNSGLGLMAVGLTFVMIAGGIDVSVGAIYPIGSVVFARQMMDHSAPIAVAITLVVGVLAGLLNGILITRLRFHPFITTLGTASLFSGIAVMYGGLNAITPKQDSFATLGTGTVAGLPYVVLILAAVVAIGTLILHRSTFGRSLYVIGGSPEVARQVGMRADLYRIATYVISGVCASLAGLLFASQSGVGQATIGGNSFSLTAVAMVVLGGTSLYGGVGAMWRTVAGFLILSTISTLFVVLGIGQPEQNIVEGTIVVIALVLDATSRRTKT